MLLIAPMSGHFATLLRGTVRALLLDHEVCITDWKNIRDTPLMDGAFGLDGFIGHIIGFIRELGPQSHVVAVCQPTVAALGEPGLSRRAQSHRREPVTRRYPCASTSVARISAATSSGRSRGVRCRALGSTL